MLFQKLMGKGPTSMISPSAPKGLWSWGSHQNGQLGLGDYVSRSSPVQVGASITWASVSAAGSNVSHATKTDGTLWSWGGNANGQLGLGDQGAVYNARSSPTQIGTLATWQSVTEGQIHTLAVKTNGTLWGWGYNSQGQLGLGDAVRRASPVQVG